MYKLISKDVKRDYIALNNFHLFKKTLWFVILFPSIFAVLGIIRIISTPEDIFFTIPYFFIALLFIPLVLLFNKIFMNSYLNKNKIYSQTTEVVLTLDEEKLTYVTHAQKSTTLLETEYSEVYRVYKSKGYLFLYVANNQAMIMPLSGVIDATESEVVSFLKTKLKEKFID